MEYKVGDWVQLIDSGGFAWTPEMEKWYGAVVQLTRADKYAVEFDGSGRFRFHINDIAGYAKNQIVINILKDL